MPSSRNPIVIVPARLGSTRLPDKVLADIHGAPMIVHVWRRAMEADIGPVVVACAESAVAEAVTQAGGRAVLTRPGLPSGSDRVYEALETVDPDGAHEIVINLQGDLPTLDPLLLRTLLEPLDDPAVDIATLAAEIHVDEERTNPNVTKPAVLFGPGQRIARALYFSRSPVPWPGADADQPLYHHIGLYAYRRAALQRFVGAPQSALEARERLEQLRALDLGLRIDVALVDTVPPDVNTPADLERARVRLAPAG